MNTDHYKDILQNRLKELNTRLQNIEMDLDAPVDKDFSEQAVEREDDEVLEILGNSGLEEIQKIDDALKRIDNGAFGICMSCGNEISGERLNVVPYAAYCKNCPE